MAGSWPHWSIGRSRCWTSGTATSSTSSTSPGQKRSCSRPRDGRPTSQSAVATPCGTSRRASTSGTSSAAASKSRMPPFLPTARSWRRRPRTRRSESGTSRPARLVHTLTGHTEHRLHARVLARRSSSPLGQPGRERPTLGCRNWRPGTDVHRPHRLRILLLLHTGRPVRGQWRQGRHGPLLGCHGAGRARHARGPHQLDLLARLLAGREGSCSWVMGTARPRSGMWRRRPSRMCWRGIDTSTGAAFSPIGSSLLIGPGDGSPTQLWDAASGRQIGRLLGTSGDVAGFSSNGRLMVTTIAQRDAGGAPAIGVWDTATWRLIKVIQTGPARAAISPDGTRLFSYDGDTSGPNGAVWDIASGAKLRTIEQPGGIERATFSPDGRTVLAVGRDNVARLWDPATGALVRELRGHTNTIWDGVFSRDGRYVLTASADKSARMWDVAVGAADPVFPRSRVVVGVRCRHLTRWQSGRRRELRWRRAIDAERRGRPSRLCLRPTPARPDERRARHLRHLRQSADLPDTLKS